jgi:hypothetical protein
VTSVLFLAFLVGFACLLHLLLIFPKPKKVMDKKAVRWLLYLPVGLFTLVAIATLFFDLRAGALRSPAAVLIGVILVAYVLLSLGALVHSFLTSGPGERAAAGLNLMMAGVVVGLLPLIGMVVAGMFVRIDLLPGGDWAFLPLVLVPISFAAGLVKAEAAHG